MSEQSEIIKEEDINININNDKINNNEDKINNNNNNKIQKYNQHQVINKQKLLDKNGNIQEPGYAFNQVWEYSRKDIKASNWRIKEWDYYYIGNQDCGLCLTLSDIGYVGCLGKIFNYFICFLISYFSYLFFILKVHHLLILKIKNKLTNQKLPYFH